MQPTPLDQIDLKDGDALSISGLIWPRAYFPTRTERATFIAGHLPPWAIPAAHTAGWIWTGMGSPLPWSVLRPKSPAPSPILREQWRARQINFRHHVTTLIQGTEVLSPESTILDILAHGRGVDGCATQLLVLEGLTKSGGAILHRPTPSQSVWREALDRRLADLKFSYPDMTR
jgi:hypothetical protein